MSLPQRESRPALSIKPEADIPDNASWCESYTAGNPLNDPVDVRKGKPVVNGWQTVVGDTYPSNKEEQ